MPTKASIYKPNASSSPSTPQRGTTAERGYGSRWQRARKQFLNLHPLCIQCGKTGRVTEATRVDHVVPHKGNQSLFWDQGNWQPMCESHHNAKSAKEKDV